MDRASSAPWWVATTMNPTGVPTWMVRVPSAMAVQWNDSSVPAADHDRAQADPLVERLDGPGARGDTASIDDQWTILDSGSSMMSVAPASLSAGIRMLISFFGTTVSTA